MDWHGRAPGGKAGLTKRLAPFPEGSTRPPQAPVAGGPGTYSGADQIAVPVGKDVRLWVKNSRLSFPGGALTVVGVGPARIDRWMELFQKVSPP